MGTVKKKNAAKQAGTSQKTYKKYKPVLNKMQEGSQNYKILKHILDHGKITSFEAYNKYRCTRLSARIWDLRYMYGVPIESEMVTKKRNKEYITYAEYTII